jgi:hypothetical protein
MAEVHIIRQDYARALAARDADWSPKNEALLFEVEERRARAIRMIAREDDASVRHLSAMFRTSKTAIREALAVEDEA